MALSGKNKLQNTLTLHMSTGNLHVDFISFENNQFEIEEKQIKKVTELESIPRKL
jgi:hypothetical protein